MIGITKSQWAKSGKTSTNNHPSRCMGYVVRKQKAVRNGPQRHPMDSINNLMSRVRRTLPVEPWESYDQPIPLVKVVAQPIAPGSSSIRYVATGITTEAEAVLSQLPVPIYIVAFAGFGRSGKSFTATTMRKHLTGNEDHKFVSAPGNIPVTHGIDMMVFPNPKGDGNIVFLDCEGGANHNQTALPFVMGLAARLATRMYVFERGCFTTSGLDTVMQVINMVIILM